MTQNAQLTPFRIISHLGRDYAVWWAIARLYFGEVERRDGSALILARGRATLLMGGRIAAQAIPSASSSQGLWEMFWNTVSAEERAALFTMEKPFLERTLVEARVGEIIEKLASASTVLAGREMPIRPTLPYSRIAYEDCGFWNFDPLTEEAHPRRISAVPAYGALRLMSAAEWKAMTEEPSAPSKPNGGRALGGRSATYDWDAFTVEVVRFANLDGFDTRRQLMEHMTDWCAKHWEHQPSDRTLRTEVAKRCPPEIPEK